MKAHGLPVRTHEWQMWKQRYQSLDNMIGILHDQVKEDVSRGATIKALLGKLREFAKNQFSFLYHGLDPREGKRPYLEPVHQFPPDFVLEATLDQVAYDLVVLQGAWYQRSLIAQGNTPMERTLTIADRLTYHALLPALQSGLLPFDPEQVTVLTYFQKAPHIRMIPYASVALVGIPFTTLGEYEAGKEEEEFGKARDLLAIPHEVGHYVYQHGSFKGRRLPFELHDVLQGRPEWLLRWAEEIFADVYGCFIAGPVIVRDFQDLMKDNDIASFVRDDNEHPTPALRPLLYVDALKILADRCEVKSTADYLLLIANRAEEKWDKYRRNRGQEVIDERRETIKEAIATAFNYLVPPGTVSVDHLWSHPDPDVEGAEAYENLYKSFYKYVSSEENGLLARLQGIRALSEEPAESEGAAAPAAAGPHGPPEIGDKWDTPLEKIPALRWLKQIRKNDEGHETSEEAESRPESFEGQESYDLIPAEVWTLVVSMDGWATNGPETQPEPKLT